MCRVSNVVEIFFIIKGNRISRENSDSESILTMDKESQTSVKHLQFDR